MTQIKKTLSIAGIIAMVVAPAMAEIASTQYVQNVLSGITGALDAKLSNNVTEGDLSIGIGVDAYAESMYPSIAIGKGAYVLGGGIAIGSEDPDNNYGAAKTDASDDIAIGPGSYTGANRSIAIGYGARTTSEGIQLGTGENSNGNKLQVYDTPLLNAGGIVPYSALATNIPDECLRGQKCALVMQCIDYGSGDIGCGQAWEIVRSTTSGQ